MSFASASRRSAFGVLLSLPSLALTTSCRERAAPPPPRSDPAPLVCVKKNSDDPPRFELQKGIALFDDKRYAEARQVFQGLSASRPECATCQAWLGDAWLFDKDLDEREAARLSRPAFAEAARLHDAGCVLPRRPRYYLLMGEAYGALRLARTSQVGESAAPYDRAELDRARDALELAEAEFASSAEVPFNLARVDCAEALLEHFEADAERAADLLDACATRFEVSLGLADSLSRPRFLRTHRSTQDWIVRSRTQSEFVELRKLPRYGKAVKDALQHSQDPVLVR